MNEVLKQMQGIGIIPVIKIDDANKAVPLAKALVKGGLPVAEVTFRTAAAKEAITRIAKEVPEMLVGAGTVLTTAQVDEAMEAGSKFIVSPGFNPTVTKYALSKGACMTPGTATPGEMEQAMELGLEAVKFFPAEQNGGVAKLKAVSGPYTKLMFMPTGGVNAKNLNDYLSFDKIIACGGTWMVPAAMIDAEDWDGIVALTKEAVRAMLGFELAHVGINAENEAEAEKAAKMFTALFGFEYKPGNSSIFAGKAVEVMKAPYLGKNGHIGIATNSVLRAEYHLKMQGFEFNEESRKTDAKGNTIAVYLKDEVAGFAVHLVQKK